MKDIMNDILSAAGAEVSIIPVVQGEGMMKIDQAQLPDSLPILALRNAVLFPGTVFPITIGREKSMRLIEDAERTNSFIGAVPQNDLSVEEPHKEDLFPYGTVAKIVKTLEMPDGTVTAILQGFKRFEVEEVVDYEPYMLGRVRYLEDIVPEDDAKLRVIADTLKEKATAIIRSSSFVPREAVGALKGIDSFEFLVNFIATTIEVENFMDKVEYTGADGVKAEMTGSTDAYTAFIAKISADGKFQQVKTLASTANETVAASMMYFPMTGDMYVTPRKIQVEGDRIYVSVNYAGDVAELSWKGSYIDLPKDGQGMPLHGGADGITFKISLTSCTWTTRM